MNNRFIILVALILGIVLGMVNHQLILPVVNQGNMPYYHGIRGKDQVSLTINVDWGEEFLPAMLEVLKEKDVKVTFFVTGRWAGKFPDMLAQMAAAGHEIGNHGYSHQHPKDLTEQELIELIKKNEEQITRLTGQQIKLFAPPYGEVDQRITGIAGSIGYKTIMWSADTIDWQRPAPEIIVQRAVNKIEDGGIILMHPTEPSLAALPEIIDKINNRGFTFVPVSQLIE